MTIDKLRSHFFYVILIFLLVSFLTPDLVSCWGRNNARQKGEEKDLYKILELPKNASKNDIKRQYRKLTRKYHPDVNPNEKERFTNIAEAYEILSDDKKRRIYDRQGYQAAKEADMHGEGHGGGDPFADIFSSFFGGGRARHENKHEDVRVKLRVSLKDLFIGREISFHFSKNVVCPHCRGSGAESDEDVKQCGRCGGQGVILERQQIAPGFVQQFQRQCPSCNGKGKTITRNCHLCQGEKIVKGLEEMSVFVEKGMKDGQEIVGFNLLRSFKMQGKSLRI